MVGDGLSLTLHTKDVVLVRFSDANCGSFDERQELSLLASNLEDYEMAAAGLDVFRN